MAGSASARGGPWRSGAYVGEFADAFCDNTELEGNDPSSSIEELVVHLRSLRASVGGSGPNIYTNAAVLDFLIAKFSDSLENHYSSNPTEAVQNIQRKVRSLAVDDLILVPAGWASPKGGHAIQVALQRVADDKVSVIFINSGAGIGNHPSRSGDLPKGGRTKLAFRMRPMSLERAIDPVAIWLLLRTSAVARPEHGASYLYQGVFSYWMGRDLPECATPGFKHEDDQYMGDFMSPQRAGTCYFRCQNAALRFLARLRGESRDDVKRLTLALRLQFMQHTHSSLMEQLAMPGGLALTQSDVELIRIGCHQSAYHALRNHAAGRVTPDQLRHVEGAMARIQQTASRMARIDGYVDPGYQRPDFPADGVLRWSPMAGGGALAMRALPPGPEFAGDVMPRNARDPLDLTRLPERMPRTLDELEKQLREAKRCVSAIREGFPEGGAMPAYITSAFVGDFFMNHLPFDQGEWFNERDRHFGRDALGSVRELLRAFLKAFYHTPRIDSHGEAFLKVAVQCAFCFVECIFRGAGAASEDELAMLLNGSLTARDFREGIPPGFKVGTRLAWPHVSTAGTSFEEATRLLDMMNPQLVRARQRCCDFIRRTAAPDTFLPLHQMAPGKPSLAEGNECLVQAEAMVRLTGGEFMPSGVLDVAAAAMRCERSTLVAAAVPHHVARACWLTGQGVPHAGNSFNFRSARDLIFLQQTLLLPGVVRSSFAAEAAFASLDGEWKLGEWNDSLSKVKTSIKTCGKDQGKNPCVPGLSHVDARMHGVQRAHERAGSQAGPVDEDDVALSKGVDSFDNTLPAEDSDRLLSYLTAPALRIPLLLAFFAEGRIDALFSPDVRQLLQSAIFQPERHAYASDAEPPSSRNFWGCRGGGVPAGPAVPTTVPATRGRSEDFGTAWGLLWHELSHSPAATLTPLMRVVELTGDLCGSSMEPAFVSTFFFVFKLALRISLFAKEVAAVGQPGTHPCAMTQHAATHLDGLRRSLARTLRRTSTSVLDFYQQQARARKDKALLTAAHAHEALAALAWPLRQPADLDSWTPRGDAEFVGRTVGALSFVSTWHTFGLQHDQAGEPSEFRSRVPRPAAYTAAMDQRLPGLEPLFLASGLYMSEADLFEMLQLRRRLLTKCMQRLEGTPGLTTCLESALRLATQNPAAQWPGASPVSVDGDDPVPGCYTDSVDGAARYQLQAQVGQLREPGGGEVKPVPEMVARHWQFKRFFRREVPYCTVIEERSRCRRYAILSSPATAPYGELEVALWEAASPSTPNGRQDLAMLAMRGWPSERGGGGWDAAGRQFTRQASFRGGPGGQAELAGAEAWAQQLLDTVWIDELCLHADPAQICKKCSLTSLSARLRVLNKGAQELLAAPLFAQRDPGADQLRLLSVCGDDDDKRAYREIVLTRATGLVEVFLFEESCRQVYKRLVFASDARLTKGSVAPAVSALPFVPPAYLHFRGGDLLQSPLYVPSIEIKRTRLEGGSPVSYTLEQPYFLNGLVPAGLLAEPGMLWWRGDHGHLLAEPVPPSSNAQTGTMGGGGGEGEGEEDEEGGGDAAAGDEEDEDAGSSSVYKGPSFLLRIVILPGDKLCISRTVVEPGARGDAQAVCAAEMLHGDVHKRQLRAIATGNAAAPELSTEVLLELEGDDARGRLGSTLARAESLSHVLAWMDSVGTVGQVEGDAPLKRVSLPRLGTEFVVRRGPHGQCKLYLADRGGVSLCDSQLTGTNLRPTHLMKGLPHALIAEGDDGSVAFLVPSHPLCRVGVHANPFGRFCAQQRGHLGWELRVASKMFFFPVAVSESFLLPQSLAGGLYYLNCLLAHRHYSAAAKHLRSISCDRELSAEEAFFVRRIALLDEDKHPDMHACRVKLFAAIGYSGFLMPFNPGKEYGSFQGKRGHVRMECQLAETEESTVLDMLQRKLGAGEDDEDKGGNSGNDVFEAYKKLRRGEEVPIKYKVAARGPSSASSFFAYEGEGAATAMKAAVDTPRGKPAWQFWVSASDESRAWGSKSGNDAFEKMAELLVLGWQSSCIPVLELAIGQKKLSFNGQPIGRRFATCFLRMTLLRLWSFEQIHQLTSCQGWPFYAAGITARINADGSPAKSAEEAGFPQVPAGCSGGVHQKDDIQRWVRRFSKQVHDAIQGSDRAKTFVQGRRKLVREGGWSAKSYDGPTLFPGTPVPPLPAACADSNARQPLALKPFDHMTSGAYTQLKCSMDAVDLYCFATRPLLKLGNGWTRGQGIAARGVDAPPAALPFDVDAGAGVGSGFVADEMLKRMRADLKRHHDDVTLGETPQMLALATGAQTPAALHAAAAGALAHLDILRQRIVELREADARAVRNGFRAVVREANACAGDDLPSVVVRLERLAGQRQRLWDELMMAALVSSRSVDDLQRLHGQLDAGMARAALESTAMLVLRSCRVEHCSKALATLLSLRSLLQKVVDGGAQPPSEALTRRAFQVGESLAGLLDARRHHAEVDASHEQMTATEARMHPAFVVFEFLFGWLLRPRQVELVQAFVDDARRPDGAAPESAVRQMIMGAGKTTVIAPLLVLFLADGERLISQVVPSELLPQSIRQLWSRFTRILPKPVLQLHFDRTKAVDIKFLSQLAAKLDLARTNRGVIVAPPTALKSLVLCFMEQAGRACGHNGRQETRVSDAKKKEALAACKHLAKIIGLLYRGRILMDEIDLLMSPLKSELNFPFGEDVLLEPRPGRWLLPIQLLGAILTAFDRAIGRPTFADLISATPAGASTPGAGTPASAGGGSPGPGSDTALLTTAIREGLASKAVQRSPHLVVLSPKFYSDHMRDAVASWIVSWLMTGGKLRAPGQDGETASPCPLSAEQVRALLDAPAADPQCTARQMERSISAVSRQMLALSRTWLDHLVPHCLGKISRVSFGLLTDAELTREGNGPETGKKTGGRASLAVPFLGLDVPSLSEFAHPDVLLGLSVLAYRYQGLQPRHIHALVKLQRFSMKNQPGAYPQRPARHMFQIWVNNAKAVWEARFGEAAQSLSLALNPLSTNGSAALSRAGALQVPTAEDLGLTAAEYREAERGAPRVPPLEFIQPQDRVQMAEVHRLLRFSPEVIEYWLHNAVFPADTDVKQSKLSASGQELGGNMLVKSRLGFSGTPNDLLPFELGKCNFEPGSEGKILATVTNPSVFSALEPPITGDWTVRDLLRRVATADPPFHALIDTGALVTGMDNEEVARALLRYGLKGMVGCVYLSKSDEQMVVLRGRPAPVPLSEVGVPREQRFTFYDQVHTTGTDVKQGQFARAAITLGKDMTLRDYAQGAWRMRGIGIGQTLEVVIVPEIDRLMRATRGAAFGSEPVICSVTAWLIRNSVRFETMQFAQLCQQDLGHCFRRAALDDVLSAHGDTGRGGLLEGKGRSASDMSAPLKVFNQVVDFSVRPDAVPSDFNKLARDTEAEFGAFLRGEEVRARLAEITRRANTLRGGGGGGDSGRPEGLDTEMVQEQEVLQEVSQEQDQEVLAEIRSWFCSFDVEVARGRPAPVAAVAAACAAVGGVGPAALLQAFDNSFPMSQWQIHDTVSRLQPLRDSLLLSGNWAPAGSLHPDWKAKNATVMLRMTGTPTPASMVLSLGEAEALRRCMHHRAASQAAPLAGLDAAELYGIESATLLDTTNVAMLPQLPAEAPEVAINQFLNAYIWYDEPAVHTMLDALAGTAPADRLGWFDRLLLRRRQRIRPWAGTGAATVFAMRDKEELERQRETLRRLNAQIRGLSLNGRRVNSMADVFFFLDDDNDGQLSVREFENLLQRCGLLLSAAELSSLVALVDTNRDGTVDLAEFCQVFRVDEEQVALSRQASDELAAGLVRDDFDDMRGALQPSSQVELDYDDLDSAGEEAAAHPAAAGAGAGFV